MEHYIVSARKYRPSTFASVVGQQALTSTLKNAIDTGRLAHAYLFCGSRGVGKTSCARIFAKTINCTNRTADGEACNECESCRSFNDSNSFNIVELDAASNNGVEDMRALIDKVMVPPTNARYRVFIIDEVHMLSQAAFNAFLKTLEEPPAHAIFILATTEKHKIIPTILSRCQIYDFSRITVSDMVRHLHHVADSEHITAEPSALHVIARQADGAMRDALSIFDQVAASSRGNITYESTLASLNVLDSSYFRRLVDACRDVRIPDALLVFHEVRRKGFDAHFFINGLGEYLRDLMLGSSPSTLELIDAPDDVRAAIAEQAATLKPEWIYAAMGLCNDCDLNYRQSANKQLLVELTIIRIAQLLSPSPVKSGKGEGPIRPIQPAAQHATPAPAPEKVPDSTNAANLANIAKPAAQAPAQPAPVAAPRMANQRPAPTGPAVLRVGGLSMRPRTTSEAPEAAPASHHTPYTDDAVIAAWDAFGNRHQAEPAFFTLIQKNKPKRTALGSNDWTIELEQTAAGVLSEHLDEIIAHVRSAVSNDDFTIHINIRKTGLGPEYWSDTQVLQYLRRQPLFDDFCNIFGLKLL